MKHKKITIGASGDRGSFSEMAANKYIKAKKLSAKIVYLIDMDGVLSALEKGTIGLGIFPVVNSQGGLVQMAFEAMGKYKFIMTSHFPFNVHQCLLVLPSHRGLIKKIYSHPQGLSQCRLYLKKNFPNSKLLNWQDTAMAARDLAAGKLAYNSAVIAPASCAKIYGLKILRKNIEDANPNITTFIVVKKDLSYNLEFRNSIPSASEESLIY